MYQTYLFLNPKAPFFRKTCLNLHRKLPPQDQLIIKAVTNAKNVHNPTTQKKAQPTSKNNFNPKKTTPKPHHPPKLKQTFKNSITICN
jgi:hypothetical protein